jgi:multisite-specific tRNA:(cytosine-C5)-methyltransferase
VGLKLTPGCHRERKREAGTPVDEPELKKPRFDYDGGVPANDMEPELYVATLSVPLTKEDVVMENRAEEPNMPTLRQAAAKGKGKAKGDGGFKENPYTYLASDDPILQSCMFVCSSQYNFRLTSICRTRLNLNADFPASNVLVRNPEGDAVRSLYLTNRIIKTIVEHNDYTRLRIINCGTKVFTKQDGGRGMEASFRVLGEGLPVVFPYIDPETIMDCDIGILKTLISVYYPLCVAFPEPFKSAVEARGEYF